MWFWPFRDELSRMGDHGMGSRNGKVQFRRKIGETPPCAARSPAGSYSEGRYENKPQRSLGADNGIMIEAGTREAQGGVHVAQRGPMVCVGDAAKDSRCRSYRSARMGPSGALVAKNGAGAMKERGA